MKRLSETITLLSGILSALFLVLDRLKQWDLPLLETLCWVVLILDVFIVLIRPQILGEMASTRSEILALLGVSLPKTISDPFVRKYSHNALAAISTSLDEFKQKHCYIIENPYVARDISFEIIQSIQNGDKLWATVNLVDRPFLMKEAYTSYFLSIHEEAMRRRRTHIEFTRILIVGANVTEGDLATSYDAFRESLKNIGISVLETSPESFQDHAFPGDLLIRTRGYSSNKCLCLLGDKDPTTPLDAYSAKLLTGECSEFDHWLDKVKALCRQITGGSQ